MLAVRRNIVTPTSTVDMELAVCRALATPVSASAPVRVVDLVTLDGPQTNLALGVQVVLVADHGLELTPILVGADNCQCTIDVRRWKRILPADGPIAQSKPQWTSKLIARLLATASAATGVANGQIDTTMRYCDLIAASVDRTPGGVKIYQKAGGGDDEPASVLLDGMGCSCYSLHFNTNGLGSAATSALAIVSQINQG